MQDFKFSDNIRQTSNVQPLHFNFANRVDPTDLLKIRDPEDISGLSVRGITYLKGVQENILEQIEQPGGKSAADGYLARQMEKFTDLNGEDAAKVRTELYDYITAVTYFA